mgnify:CR=1 FL=1
MDEAHLPFTHRQSLFDEINFAVPEISAKETNFGLTQYGKRSGGQVNEAHFMMPNMLTFNYPATNDSAVMGWPLYLSWRVPVDDTKHRTFIVEHFNVKADDVAAFRIRRKTIKEQTATMPPREEVSAAILAGKAQLFDYADRPDCVGPEDSPHYDLYAPQEGVWEYFDREGVLERTETPLKPEEYLYLEENYDRNGALKSRGPKIEEWRGKHLSADLRGRKDGSWEYFNEDGNLTKTETYKDGELVE